MAWANKYRFRFNSVHGVEYNIYIQKDGYSGDVIQRNLGRAPVLRKKQNGPICGTSLELYAECSTDGEFAELYTSNPKEYRVNVYRAGSPIWTGFVSTELYSEPSISPPYDVQIVATDGLGELKLNSFEPQGTAALKSILIYLLSFTGSGRGFYFATNLKHTGGTKAQMLSWNVNLDFLDGKSCYDVLTKLLESLHATITTYGDRWLIARETDIGTLLNNGTLSVIACSSSGTVNTTAISGVSKTAGKMGIADLWPVGYLSSAISPARNSVTVQAPWHIAQAIKDASMEDSTSAHWSMDSHTHFVSSLGRGYYIADGWNAYERLTQEIHMAYLQRPLKITVLASAGSTFGNITEGRLKLYAEYIVGSNVMVGSEEGWAPNNPYGNSIAWFELGPVVAGADESNAQEYSVTIPPLKSDNAGTLRIVIEGYQAYVCEAILDIVQNNGYQDTIYLDNGARGAESPVEIIGQRLPSAGLENIDFYQGIWLYNNAEIMSFEDSHFSNADFLSIMALGRATSAALPREKKEGILDIPVGLSSIPLFLSFGGVSYSIETYNWDLYNDELKLSALSLPAASITVDNEVVEPIKPGGSSSADGGVGDGTYPSRSFANYFEEDGYGNIKLKDQYLGLWSNGFLSAGGLNPNGGGGTGGGLTALGMWKLLTNDDTLASYNSNTKIAAAHIPIGGGLSVDANTGLIYVTNPGGVTSVAGLTGNVEASALYNALGLNTEMGIVSDALRSVQSQIDSVAARNMFDELYSSSFFSDIISASYLCSGSISLGGRYNSAESKLVWDSANNAWHLIGNFYADGWVSAAGVNPGSGGGGGGGGLTEAGMWNILSNGQAVPPYGNDTKIARSHLDVGAAAYYAVASSITENDSTHLVTGAAVFAAISSAVANATHFRGGFDASSADGTIDGGGTLKSVAEKAGDLYTVTTAGTFAGTALEVGDSIIFKADCAAGTAVTSAYIIFVEATVSVTNNAATLALGSAVNLAQVEGVNITAKLPNLYIGSTAVRTTNNTTQKLTGISGISNSLSSDGTEQSYIVWEPNAGGTGIGAWHFKGNLYADGFISAGGINPNGGGGGGGGLTPSGMWGLLASSSSEQIDISHLTTALSGYVTNSSLSGYVTIARLETDENVISGAIQSLQSQIDSVTTRNTFDDIISSALFADVAAISNLYADAINLNGIGDLATSISGYNTRISAIEGRFDSNGKILFGNLPTLYWGNVTVSNVSNAATTPTFATVTTSGVATIGGLLSANANIKTQEANGAYVQIGSVRLVYDSENTAIKVVSSDGTTAANFYATGFVSAAGVSSSGGGSGSLTPLGMWKLLTNDNTITTYDDDTPIDLDHLGEVQTWVNQQGFAYASALGGYVTTARLETDEVIISDVLQSIQSQIDSVSARDNYDELTATIFFTDDASVSSLYAGAIELNGSDLATSLTNINTAISNEITNRNAAIASAINALDSSTEAVSTGYFITGVTITDGKISARTQGNSISGSAGSLTTVSKTAWGQTYWTSGGVPTSISGDMSSVGSISMSSFISGATTITASGLIKTTNYMQATRFYLSDSVYFEIVDGNVHLTSSSGTPGFYADGFVSAAGASSSGSGGGINADAMWQLLAGNTTEKINTSHLPTLSLTGLTGGYSSSTTLALSLAQSGVGAGTYTKVTVDTYGRATSGTTLSASDIPTLAISKIDGLQTALNGKQAAYGFTITGTSGSTYNLDSFVTSSGVTSIGMTVPTGLSVSPASITGTGTFAVTYASGYSIPLTADTTKGVTAYGWGNHADAGYLTSSNGTTISKALQSLQSQIDAVAANSNFDEIVSAALFADTLSASAIYASTVTATSISGSLSGNATTASYLSSSSYSKGSGTNPVYFSGGLPVACSYSFGNGSGNVPISNGTMNTNLYANKSYLDSDGYDIAGNMTKIGTAIRSLQSQVDSVAAARSFDELTVTAGFFDTLSVGANFGASGNATILGNVKIGSYATPSYALDITGSIYASGSMGIGTAPQSSYKLTIDGNTRSYGDILLDGNNEIQFGSASDSIWYKSSGTEVYFDFSHAAHFKSGLYSDSYVSAGGLSSSSDARLKNNITPVSRERAKEVIMALRPCEWIWNEKNASFAGKRGAGLVAQEVRPFLPDAVADYNDYLSLYYTQFHAFEIGMLQSHEDRLEKAEKRIAVLEAENAQLKARLNA